MSSRRFPPPWSVEETDACYIVRDANGHALAYVYFEEEPGAGGDETDDARRGPAHRRQHCQAAGAVTAGVGATRRYATLRFAVFEASRKSSSTRLGSRSIIMR
jgi:hypothetical protein